MAIIKLIKDKFTREVIYPITKCNAVYNENGERLDEILESLDPNANVEFESEDVGTDTDSISQLIVPKMVSGETTPSLFHKVSQMFTNIRYLLKILGTTDITNIGDGTVTGAINSLSNNYCYIWKKNFAHNYTVNTNITSGFTVYNQNSDYVEASSYGKINIKKPGVYLCIVSYQASARADINRVMVYGVASISGTSLTMGINGRCPTWDVKTGFEILRINKDTVLQVIGRDESGTATVANLNIVVIPLFI